MTEKAIRSGREGLLRRNATANFAGRFFSLAMAIICTPFYIHFLGVAAYGVIGFYVTLQASMLMLDMGLGRACTREIALLSGVSSADNERAGLETLRSLEIVYWGVAVLIGLSITLSSSWIATHWLNSEEIHVGKLADIIVLMGWVIALRWPSGLYNGALYGQQRHVLLNVMQIITALMGWGGAVIVIWLVHRDLEAYFLWQLLVAIFGTVALACVSWKSMPGSFGAVRFSLPVLTKMFPFAMQVGVNSVLGTLLLQADKLILSSMVTLKEFGYYSLASMIASAISNFGTPISNAIFPKFSQMIGAGCEEKEISGLYHLACQIAAALIVPTGLVVAFFSPQLLFAYTGHEEVIRESALILSLLVIAKTLHAVMLVPYSLQMAYGWVSMSNYLNIAAILWLVPAIYVLVESFGTVGAALAWLVVPIAYVLIGGWLMHRKLLVGEWWRWMVTSILIPAATISLFLLSIKLALAGIKFNRWSTFGELLVIGAGAMAVAVFSLGRIREMVILHARKTNLWKRGQSV